MLPQHHNKPRSRRLVLRKLLLLRRTVFDCCEIWAERKEEVEVAQVAPLPPATKNSSISLYPRIFTAGAAAPLPCASARNACSDCATMARARSFLRIEW